MISFGSPSTENNSANSALKQLMWKYGLVIALTVLAAGVPLQAAAIPAVPAWRTERPWTTERAVVTVGDDVVIAEIADAGAIRSRGLAYRDGLEPGAGMLFVFSEQQTRTFWMKGMRFCLDIIWITGGEVIGFQPDFCPSPGVDDADLPHAVSPEPVEFVLEVPAGWMASTGNDVGSPVTIKYDTEPQSAGA